MLHSIPVVAILLMALPTGAQSAERGCLGTFKADSQGYLASEGGAEPTGDRRKAGETGRFLYVDRMEGERYYRLADGDEHKAKLIELAARCKLPRLRPGGKY